MENVADAVLPLFRDVAARLIAERGAEDALCAALALITGHTRAMAARSLLSNSTGYVTLLYSGATPIHYPSDVWGQLRRKLDAAVTENVRGLQITADKVRRRHLCGWCCTQCVGA
jgi:ATP-dependent RNA helicase DDX21